jgi:hypothetical protein
MIERGEGVVEGGCAQVSASFTLSRLSKGESGEGARTFTKEEEKRKEGIHR